ncbi:MAG TPA: class I SAM-dependent methyltransferase, partial [candidate division Zixibacteria bacterium]|nr:class I SAM-dependent methyltransferase [candidate division Zixibacteria bacterium]
FLSVLPASVRYAISHTIARWNFERYMRGKLGHFYLQVDHGPAGKKELIMKTAILNESDVRTKTDANFYFNSGYEQMLSWLQILERHGFNVRTASAIMELGCGSARLIRHLRCIDGINLVGSDLSSEMVEWCSRNIPGIEFHQNNLKPPLEFADDDTFDLVFAGSVFTHIPIETQGLWIRELNRVIRPGGFLLCDVLGRYHQERMLGPDEMSQLRQNGAFTLTAIDKRASLSTKIIGSWDVFLLRGEVLKAFGSSFVVLDYLPRPLDLLVLQKVRKKEE